MRVIASSVTLPLVEHARVRRERKEILRETVVDVARDAGSFLGDSPPELGRADRAPDTDEQHAEGDHAQEVARRRPRSEA